MIMKFRLFESKRPVISYDLDGVLHKSVSNGEPFYLESPELWEPIQSIFDNLFEESKDHEIIICTARDSWNKPEIEEYVTMHGLPISAIYCTDDRPKLPVLKAVKAIRHYDDRVEIGQSLRGTGIEFRLVDSSDGTFKIIK